MATVSPRSTKRMNPAHPLDHLRSAEYLTDIGLIQEYQKTVSQPKSYDLRNQRRAAIWKSFTGFCYSLLWAGIALGLVAAMVRYLYVSGAFGV